jgi:hypothetical protein
MTIIKDFKLQGFSRINIPINPDDFHKLVSAYREFDNRVPLNEKNKAYTMLDSKNDINYGFVDRSKDNGFDNKSYFHFNPNIRNYNFLQNNSLYQQFLDDAQKVFNPLEKLVTGIIENLDNKFHHLYPKKILDKNNKPSLIMRVLNYKPKSDCQILAQPHIDRGVLSLTCYETHDGLSFIHGQSEIPVRYEQNFGNLFLGPKFKDNSILSLEGTSHQVKNTGKNTQRSSIVLFIDENLNF